MQGAGRTRAFLRARLQCSRTQACSVDALFCRRGALARRFGTHAHAEWDVHLVAAQQVRPHRRKQVVMSANMQLQRNQRIGAPLRAVLATFEDAEYPRALVAVHSFFSDVELLGLQSSARTVTRTMRYRARPFIARLGPFSPSPEWFTWTEHAVLDRSLGVLRFENVPELESVRPMVTQRGTMLFHEDRDEHGAAVTVRSSNFALGLAVPALYRPIAAGVLSLIARQIEGSLDEEVRFLERYLREPRSTSARSYDAAAGLGAGLAHH